VKKKLLEPSKMRETEFLNEIFKAHITLLCKKAENFEDAESLKTISNTIINTCLVLTNIENFTPSLFIK